ncbi:DUF938 domain-containing protein [Salinisphaera sp. T31B1]|uniref:DUF938 domain-containing protein n=1 Tax=Salinisphaera sp. T31B1 TaxID=727963 RepID=UPI00333E4738
MSTHIDDRSAAQRNKGPIFAALKPWLADAAEVLEVGAGDATHARHAVECMPGVRWQTSEAPAHHRRLVAAITDAADIGLPAPLALDVRGEWPDRSFDAVYGANVAHIMDWAAVQALFAGAAAHLTDRGVLCLYGPFLIADEAPAAGNAAFDAALRARDAGMGLREVGALDDLADAQELSRVADIPMPSDNRLLIWSSTPLRSTIG